MGKCACVCVRACDWEKVRRFVLDPTCVEQHVEEETEENQVRVEGVSEGLGVV